MSDPGKELEIQPQRPIGSGLEDWLNESYRLPETGFELEKEMLRLIDLQFGKPTERFRSARLLGVPRDYLRYRLKKGESFNMGTIPQSPNIHCNISQLKSFLKIKVH